MLILKTSLLACACPPGAAISDISQATCVEDFDQVVGAAVQRIFKNDGTKNFFDYATANPNLKASWDAFLAAADETKIQTLPQFANFESEAGTSITFGSGNQVVGGVAIIKGREPSTGTGTFYRVSQSIIKQIKALECEIGPSGGRLGIYLFSKSKQILGISDDNSVGGTPSQLYPIPLQSLYTGDLSVGTYDSVNQNNFELQFVPNWSDDSIIVNASDFDPISDLIN